MIPTRSLRRFRALLTAAILLALVAVVLVQQSRIRALQAGKSAAGGRLTTRNTSTDSTSGDSRETPPTARKHRSTEDPLAHARREHLETVEKQLEEISAPLVEDMASTMFHADIKEGQSLITGGYQTADGKNQFTILKPSVIRTPNGQQHIQIDSKLIAVSQEDAMKSGLDTLATNAKNTLQHAESWEESDVFSTLEAIRNSEGSKYLGAPSIVVAPGQNFRIEGISDDRNSYSLAGTAELSPSGSGVVLKARIQQKESPKGP
jgi:hypothetical protein